MWEGAVYSFKNNVIFGTGRDNSPKYILEYLEKENKYSEVKNKSSLKVIAQTGNMHNMYFSSLAEEGVLFLYLLWIWSFILIKEIKFQKELKVQSLEYYIMNANSRILYYRTNRKCMEKRMENKCVFVRNSNILNIEESKEGK